MTTHRRTRIPAQQPLGPEDDPYLAYLIWREERNAAARDAAEADAALPTPVDATRPDGGDTIARPVRRSWIRRLAAWRPTGADDSGR